MKISLDELANILSENKIAPETVQTIIKDCEQVAEELKAHAAPAAKAKWEYVIVLHDKEGILKDKEIAGWVVQQAQGADANLILPAIQSASVDQNDAAKRKRNVIKGFCNAFAYLKTRFLKPKNLKIKTKELTRVLVTNGSFIG